MTRNERLRMIEAAVLKVQGAAAIESTNPNYYESNEAVKNIVELEGLQDVYQHTTSLQIIH